VNSKNTALALNRLCKKLSGKGGYKSFNWSQLNYTSLIALKADLQRDNYSAGSINTYLALFKGVAANAWRQKITSTDDYLHIKDIKRIKNQRILAGRSLPASEIKSLIKNCTNQKTNAGKRNAAMIALAYGAGLRVHELVGVTINDYFNDYIKIIGKGNKERKNPLPSFISKIIDDWLSCRSNFDHTGLFLRIHRGDHIKNSMLSKQSVNKIFTAVLTRTKTEHFTPHDLRRSFATNLLSANVDLFTVQNLMGHANSDTTKMYDLRGDKVKAIAVELLPF
jgi:site-specific recombinase XerD